MVTIDKSDPRYWRAGNGPTLVLQHGFLSGAAYWQQQITALSAHFDVIATNLPGFADNHQAEAAQGIQGNVDFVLNLLDELGVQDFHLLGHSMGGMIAQQTALSAPSRVNKLVLFGTGPRGQLPGRFEPISVSQQRVREEGSQSTKQKSVASWFLLGKDDPRYGENLALAEPVSTATMLTTYQSWLDWQSFTLLSNIKSPTLIIWGDNDRSYPWSQIQDLWQIIPDCQLSVMPGRSHNAHLENPELFNLLLAQHLQQ